jgi:hypothetical protein
MNRDPREYHVSHKPVFACVITRAQDIRQETGRIKNYSPRRSAVSCGTVGGIDLIIMQLVASDRSKAGLVSVDLVMGMPDMVLDHMRENKSESVPEGGSRTGCKKS